MKNSNVYRTIGLALIFALNTAAAQTRIDRIVAVVDKEIITESELVERTTLVALQNRLDPNNESLRRQMLDGLIAEKLMLAQSFIDSIVVTDDEVTRELDQQINNLMRRAGSQERLEQIYGMPLTRIKRESREIMRKQMLVSRVRQSKEGAIQISRREVDEFFAEFKDSLEVVPEEFDLSHIFIEPKIDTTVERETRALMTALLDSLRAGGDFTDFARRYSDDGSNTAGGDLGWAKRGDYVQEFEQALFSLKVNEISDIVKTQFGFHIIQLIERRGESVHARHILKQVERGPASDSSAVEFLNALRDSLQNGVAFSDLAKRYSEDSESKAVGGDIGTVTMDMLQPEFASVVRELQEGEVSQPHRVPHGASYGYQIVHVKKRTPAHMPTLETDYRRIEQIALQVKRARVGDEWVEDLKKNIYWEIRM